jgi:hypothetical protein
VHNAFSPSPQSKTCADTRPCVPYTDVSLPPPAGRTLCSNQVTVSRVLRTATPAAAAAAAAARTARLALLTGPAISLGLGVGVPMSRLLPVGGFFSKSMISKSSKPCGCRECAWCGECEECDSSREGVSIRLKVSLGYAICWACIAVVVDQLTCTPVVYPC